MAARLILLVFFSVTFVCVADCDPIAARKAEAARLRELRQRVFQGDTAAEQALLDVIKNGDRFARTYAMREIGQLKERGGFAVETLLQLLEARGPNDPVETAYCLGHVGRDDPRVVEALLRKLQSKKEESRAFGFASALGDIGAPAAVALPALEEAAKTNGDLLPGCAKEAIEKIRKDLDRRSELPGR